MHGSTISNINKNLIHTMGNAAVSLKMKGLKPWLPGLFETVLCYFSEEKESFLDSSERV